MSDQLRKQNIEALLYERQGYQAQLARAEDESTKQEQEDNIAAVNASLASLGYREPPVVKTSERVSAKKK